MKFAEPLKNCAIVAWNDLKFQARHSCNWKKITLKNVPIAPIEELLMRWAGGSVWRGGPQLMPWHKDCPGIRHYRGNDTADEPSRRMGEAGEWPLIKTRLFWCGPIVNHFGHQISEFGGRVLLASLDPRPGQLLFLHPEGDKDINELEGWQQAWIKYLNPNHKKVLIRGGGMHAAELVVIPQQQRLGSYPSTRLLQELNKLTPIPTRDKVVVLSRAKYSEAKDEKTLRGSVAGEKAFDDWMRIKGAYIVYPERLKLAEQIEIVKSAKNLIVAEGSALHILELIGIQLEKSVTVIARRTFWKGMDRPLRSRFRNLNWIDAVQEIHWLEPANPRVKGIAKVNWVEVLRMLKWQFGWQASLKELNVIENAGSMQLRELHKKLPMKKQICIRGENVNFKQQYW